MAVTENTYTGNGSTTLYSFTFPYLEEDEIKVSLNGTLTTAYTLANATTVSFNTAPSNGAAIRIYRQTDNTTTKSTFFPGSAIRSQDLNANFLQTLYVSQESDNEAASATATANTALTNSNTAISTANTASTNASNAVTTANTASANASAAVSTANTASTNASNAVTTANTASANATTAVNTANAATTTANNATSTANTALSTANTALTNANAAVSTANTASTNASTALSTANTASTNATNAVNTANTASTNASNAVTTANAADTKANQAIAAVASAILYTVVANVAAIPGSPANNTAIEVTDSTGIQSFTPLAGKPAGFTGSSGLSVRIVYSTAGATWNWIQYFPNDPETRYLKLSGGTLTGALTLSADPVSNLQPATKQYVDTADSTLTTAAAAAQSTANAALPKAGGTMSGAIAMGTNKITGLGNPTVAQDAATKNYVDTQISGISTSSIQQGDSSVTVTDTGTGSINITADGSTAGSFANGGINLYKALFQQNSLNLTNQNQLNFWEATANGLNSVGFKGPANIASDVTWTLPATDGSANQALTTNGSSTLSWVSFLPTSGGTVTGDVLLDNRADLRFGEATANGTNWVAFQAPANITSNVTWTLPATDATVAGHALKSDAAGTLSWGTAGGAAGAGGDDVFYENGQTVTTNYTITAGKNAMSAGPITINSGATVTVGSGQTWVIV